MLKEKTECEIVTKVKYLGIEITNKNIDLYKNNYVKLWQNLEKDMEKWNKLTSLLLGKIAIIKMNILPRINFLFQTIPINLSEKVLKDWQRKLSKFIWSGKKPRIRLKVMCDVVDRGGMQAPQLQLYKHSMTLVWLKDWMTLDNRRLLNLEGFNKLFGWHAYLWYEKDKCDSNFKHHYVRNALLTCWKKYKKYYGEKIPGWVKPFEVINTKSKFCGKDWIPYDVLINKKTMMLKAVEELEYEYQWWEYWQLSEQFRKDKNRGIRLVFNELEKIMLGDNKKMVTNVYKILLKWFTEEEVVKESMIKWAINCQKEIDMDSWEHLWKKTLRISACQNVKENAMKLFYRWYLTPKKLAKMNKGLSDKCWRCKGQVGSFFHQWWSCYKVQRFWNMVVTEINEIMKIKIVNRPEFCLLGIGLENYRKPDRIILHYLLTAARLLIAKSWKGEDTPTLEDWTKKTIYLCQLDYMTRKLRGQLTSDFEMEWKHLLEYFENKYNLKREFLNIF